MAIHASDTGHNIPTDQAKIIDQDESWFSRGVREAAHIRIHRSTLNRDAGRYYLPAVYNPLLSRLTPSGVDDSEDIHQ